MLNATASRFTRALVLLGVVLATTIACSTPATRKTVIVHQERAVLDSAGVVGVVAPGVTSTVVTVARRTTVEGEKDNAPDPDHARRQLGTWLTQVARQELTKRGLRFTAAEPRGEHTDASARCVRANLDAQEFQSLFGPACLAHGTTVVMCQHLAADLGADAHWEAQLIAPLAIIGIPKAGTNAVSFRAVIRDCRSTNVLWRSEVFYRGAPDASNNDFEAAIRGVYQTLFTQELPQ
jgi:hypothetical protein